MKLPGVLLYNLSGSKGFQIEKLCKKMHITVYYVKKQEHNDSIGTLCGLDGNEKTEITDAQIPEEMFVMAGFSDVLLEEFLQAYREGGISPVGIKAVLTEHNRNWPGLQLYHELCQEREYFKEGSN